MKRKYACVIETRGTAILTQAQCHKEPQEAWECPGYVARPTDWTEAKGDRPTNGMVIDKVVSSLLLVNGREFGLVTSGLDSRPG